MWAFGTAHQIIHSLKQAILAPPPLRPTYSDWLPPHAASYDHIRHHSDFSAASVKIKDRSNKVKWRCRGNDTYCMSTRMLWTLMLGMVHNVLKKQNTKAQITELEFMCRFAKKLNFLYKLRRRHLLDVRSVTADLHTDSVVHLQKIDTIHHTNNRSISRAAQEDNSGHYQQWNYRMKQPQQLFELCLLLQLRWSADRRLLKQEGKTK